MELKKYVWFLLSEVKHSGTFAEYHNQVRTEVMEVNGGCLIRTLDRTGNTQVPDTSAMVLVPNETLANIFKNKEPVKKAS